MMKWKNLQTFSCPHCDAPLVRREDENEIVCTKCKFHIDTERYQAIMKNRSETSGNITKIKWQNLHDNRCPICTAILQDVDRQIKKCLQENCTFVIKNEKFKEIINDQMHPANRFFKPWQRMPDDKEISI